MMRVMLLLLSVLSISAYGQSDSSRYQKFSGYGFRADRLWAYNVLLAPSDTTNNKLGLARKGSTLYVGNGTYWTAAGSVSVPTLQQVLTVGATLTQDNTIDADGYTLNLIADSIYLSEKVAVNRLFLNSLAGGTSLDSLVTQNVVTGRVQRISPSRINSLNTLATVTAAGNSTTLDSIRINGMKVGYNSILGNTYYGEFALTASSGSSITAIGQTAGQGNLGSNLTLLGLNSGQNNTGSSVTAVGRNTAQNNTFDSTIHIGVDNTTATAKNQIVFKPSTYNYRLGLLNQTGNIDRTIANASGTEVLSVNSQTANSIGNITLTAGAGIDTTSAGVSSWARARRLADSIGALRLPLTGGTLTGQLANSYTSIASTPANILTGTWFTGGTATTTKPHFLIEPTGTTSTGWNTNGAGLGVNAASGFTGRLADFQTNGTSVASISATGVIVSNGGFQTAATSIFSSNRVFISSGLTSSTNGSIYTSNTRSLELVADATAGRGMIIQTGTGAVGIGTTSPLSTVHVVGAKSTLNSNAAFNTLGINVDDSSALAVGAGGGFTLRANGGSSQLAIAAIDAFKESATVSDFRGSLRFFTGSNATGYPNEVMRINSSGAIGVGTTTPAVSAILDLSSTTRGFLLPSLSTVQRDAVASVTTGLQIYNPTTNSVNTHNGINWTGGLTVSSAATLTIEHGVDYVFSGTTTTWTLPAVSASRLGRGNMITIKNRGSGAITLNSNAGSTLYTTSAVGTLTINAGGAVTLIPDGTYFNILNTY